MDEKLKQEIFDAETHFFFKVEDSIVPYLDVNQNTLMFKKDGVKYFLNNENGHIAYRKRNIIVNDKMTYTWQISKREFIDAVKWLMVLLNNCSDEYRKMCLEVIDKLDYEKGNVNAHFQVIYDEDDMDKIDGLRFNYRSLFYDLMLDDNRMLRGNIDDPWAHLNKKEVKGIEKKLVLGIMSKSKTLSSKVGKIDNK